MVIHPALILLWALPPLALAQARCQWASMNNAKDTYLYVQSTGELEEILAMGTPAGGGIRYVENNKTVDIARGILATPLPIDHDRTIFDQDACATYTELISASGPVPYVIGTQMRYTSRGELGGGLSIESIDSVVTTTGDWLFNATATLLNARAEKWDVIELGKREGREALQAVADAYLDLWGDDPEAAAARIPWGTPCRRLEGGAYTGNGSAADSCRVGIPAKGQPPVTDRRYVVDETVGAVSVLAVFGAMGRGRGRPDSHEFRVEGGGLRWVHTMTVMRDV